MLQYQGGKNLTLRHYGLADELTRWLNSEQPARIFIPFAGGGADTEHIAHWLQARGHTSELIVSDLHPASVKLLSSLARGYRPPASLTEEEWESLRLQGQVPHPDCAACSMMHAAIPSERLHDPPILAHTCPAGSDPIHGFAGFGVSYGGMYYQGYGGKSRPKWRDPVGGMSKACAKAGPVLARVDTFHTAHYASVLGPPDSGALYTARPGDFVYADIPYAGTAPYKGLPPFDHAHYWRWAGALVFHGVRVLTSEFTAPETWQRVWVTSKAKPSSAGRAGSTATVVQDGLYTREPVR